MSYFSVLRKQKYEMFRRGLFLFSIIFLMSASYAETWTSDSWASYSEKSGIYIAEDDSSCSLGSTPQDLQLITSIQNMVSPIIPKVYDICTYKDKAYFIGSNTPMNGAHHGGVIAFDGTNFTVSYDFSQLPSKEDGPTDLRVIKDHSGNEYLVVPGIEGNEGWVYTCLYVFDGSTWVRKKKKIDPTIQTEHCRDAVSFNSRLYAISTVHTTTNTFSTTEDFLAMSQVESDEVLWDTTHRYTSFPYYLRKFVEYSGELYGFAHAYSGTTFVSSKLLKFSGAELNYTELFSTTDRMTCFAIYNDNLYLGSYGGLYKFDGAATTLISAGFGGDYIYDMHVLDGTLYMAVGKNNATIDAQLWKMDSSETVTKIQDFTEQNSFSVGSYHGRLFLGTGGQGNIYVSQYNSDGFLVSSPFDTGQSSPVYADLGFTATTPTDTSVKFQIRTAATEAGLDAETFIGPDGTATDYFTTPGGTDIPAAADGKRWIQYKAFFATTDTMATPVLNSVTVDYARHFSRAGRDAINAKC